MQRKTYEKKSAECNCLNLRRASQAITDIYEEFISPSGLKLSQFSLVRNIHKLEPVSVTQLAEHLRLDRTTLVRSLKSLEERGLVIDLSNSRARNRQLKLTNAGIEALKAGEVYWAEAQQFLEQYIGKKDIETLTTLLSKIEALVP